MKYALLNTVITKTHTRNCDNTDPSAPIFQFHVHFVTVQTSTCTNYTENGQKADQFPSSLMK